MIRSTLGFIFTTDLTEVLLVTKQKPDHHKGKLNGLGGKCESAESDLECIVREVAEEAGLVIPSAEWKNIGNMIWTEWQVEIFAAIYKGGKKDIQETTEMVAWYKISSLPQNVLTNLPWLIPLSIDCLTNAAPPIVEIYYSP